MLVRTAGFIQSNQRAAVQMLLDYQILSVHFVCKLDTCHVVIGHRLPYAPSTASRSHESCFLPLLTWATPGVYGLATTPVLNLTRFAQTWYIDACLERFSYVEELIWRYGFEWLNLLSREQMDIYCCNMRSWRCYGPVSGIQIPDQRMPFDLENFNRRFEFSVCPTKFTRQTRRRRCRWLLYTAPRVRLVSLRMLIL